MSTSTRLTMEQYDELIRRGDFEPREEHHVELIYGEITPMSPINPPHHDIVSELTEWSFEVLPPKAVRVSGSPGSRDPRRKSRGGRRKCSPGRTSLSRRYRC